MSVVLKVHVLVLFFCIALAIGACSVNVDTNSKEPESEDAVAVMALTVGEPVSVQGKMVQAGALYQFKRDFTFTLSEVSVLEMGGRSLVSMCDGDFEASDLEFLLVGKSSGTQIATTPTEGFTVVSSFDFPGELPADDYLLTLLVTSLGPCQILGADFSLALQQ